MIFIYNIADEYRRIMACEAALAQRPWVIPSATEMFRIAYQIGEIAKSSTVNRSYVITYGMTTRPRAHESVAAHSNLMSALVDRALARLYGPYCTRYTDWHYSYREIMEVIRRHDLPENVTGDIPDNGSRDEAAKVEASFEYLDRFGQYSPKREYDFDTRVKALLYDMEFKKSAIGRLLYVADKVSAIIMALCYDSCGWPPTRYPGSDLSHKDQQEMALCDIKTPTGGYRASEMWTTDYLQIRQLVDYDDNGYLTALLVMYTLQVKGRWYQWRERDYAEAELPNAIISD